ncbi:MAG: cytochrome ubiquinol oxidase subunit I [Bacteroidales bacterium]|jgi:cytochrome d ubiquinol oxidase subunit I
MASIDLSLADWSRAQFALTAIYHWLFVPLTLGLSVIMALMETIYIRTKNPEWKRITKFWMSLFTVNFAIGIATGLILEFEFGTNWSNFAWFVGDIFGAPLAIEGLAAFFLEATFFVVMFFGWNKVSRKFHLLSTWLVAIGSNLSAFWILVANAWMQYPVGTKFNMDTARNEMQNFWDVAFSPVANVKFIHTVTSAFVLASVFVIGVSAWYLLRKREFFLAKKSIYIGAVFGLLSSLILAFTGDKSAQHVAKYQPMKLAAVEGLYHGQKGAGLVAIGILNPKKRFDNNENEFLFMLRFPKLLSLLSFHDKNSFIPGVNDLINGNIENRIIPAKEKIIQGKNAVLALANYKYAAKKNDTDLMSIYKNEFYENYKNIGYGYVDEVKYLVPNIPFVFYSFHFMVYLGVYFMLFFAFIIYLSYKKNFEKQKLLLRVAVWSIPLAYIASMLGWLVAEVGRQPWVIQDIMTTNAATSNIPVKSVQITFVIFAIIFTILFIANIKILTNLIKQGPKE